VKRSIAPAPTARYTPHMVVSSPIASLKAPDRWALAALFAGAVAVGASPIFVRVSELGPLATAFYRPLLAVPVLWLWMRLASGGPSRRGPATLKEYCQLLGAGALFSGDLAFWHLSILHTTVANATLFANAAPLFVTLGAWLLWRERPTRIFLFGMVLAIVGAACLSASSIQVSPENLVGDAYGVVTALFLSAYLLAVSRLASTFTTAAIMTWGSIGTALVLLPIAVVGEGNLLATTAFGWGTLLGLALFSHAAGQGLIAYALKHLPATFSAVGLLVEPVAAAALAALLLAEHPSTWQVVGGAIILTGIIMAKRGSR